MHALAAKIDKLAEAADRLRAAVEELATDVKILQMALGGREQKNQAQWDVIVVNNEAVATARVEDGCVKIYFEKPPKKGSLVEKYFLGKATAGLKTSVKRGEGDKIVEVEVCGVENADELLRKLRWALRKDAEGGGQ